MLERWGKKHVHLAGSNDTLENQESARTGVTAIRTDLGIHGTSNASLSLPLEGCVNLCPAPAYPLPVTIALPHSQSHHLLPFAYSLAKEAQAHRFR